MEVMALSSTRQRPTMRQIAKLAAVSPATVSYVLNGTANKAIPHDTRQRVLVAADTLKYQTGMLQRAIKKPLRHIGIAVANSDMAQYTFIAEIFHGVREQAAARGYSTVLHPMPPIRDLEDWQPSFDRMLDLHRSGLVDGFILDKQRFLTRTNTELVANGVPVVMVNGGPANLEDGRVVPAVTINDRRGARLAMQHLLELGHRRIAHVKRFDQFVSYPILELTAGYRQSLAEAGIDVDPTYITAGDPLDRESTESAVRALMDRSDRPTALFIGDDLIAVMAIHTLRRMGLRVPDDVSVVGYDDWRTAIMVSDPPLTTVRVPLRENGGRAVEMLLGLIEEQDEEYTHVKLEPQLVVRASTSPVQ